MAEMLPFEWATQTDHPDDDTPASIFPTFGMEQFLTLSLVPLDSPARLENHKDDFATLMEVTNKDHYSIEHASTKTQLSLNTKRHVHNDVVQYERKLRTDATTGYAVKSARYPSLIERLRTPSAAKKAFEDWKQNNDGNWDMPEQYMTFSSPSVVNARGRRQLLISCRLSKSYPNFHLLGIYQYVDHTEEMHLEPKKEVRLASVMLQTRENTWWIAMEQPGHSDVFLKRAIGDVDYARLDNTPLETASRGHHGDMLSPEGYVQMDFQKKITVPIQYDLGRLWCRTVGFYQVDLLIPEAGAKT